MCELDHKEGWAPKNWCCWIVVLEKTLESSQDSNIKQVNLKGSQPWIFIGRMDAKAEAPIPWPADVKSQVIGKDPDAGKDWRQEKGTKDNEMVGWHHQLNVHEFEQTLGDGKGQEAWHAAVHGVTNSWTWVSNWITIKNKLKLLGSKWFALLSSKYLIYLPTNHAYNTKLKRYESMRVCVC